MNVKFDEFKEELKDMCHQVLFESPKQYHSSEFHQAASLIYALDNEERINLLYLMLKLEYEVL